MRDVTVEVAAARQSALSRWARPLPGDLKGPVASTETQPSLSRDASASALPSPLSLLTSPDRTMRYCLIISLSVACSSVLATPLSLLRAGGTDRSPGIGTEGLGWSTLQDHGRLFENLGDVLSASLLSGMGGQRSPSYRSPGSPKPFDSPPTRCRQRSLRIRGRCPYRRPEATAYAHQHRLWRQR